MNVNDIVELEARLSDCQERYYAGHPVMPDSEYDALFDLLKKEKPDSVVVTRVGRELVSSKLKHRCPMGSQNKATTQGAFSEWFAKYAGNEMLVQYKLDGCSLELQYLDGSLVYAITRGDGIYGENVTNNAKKIAGVVQSLNRSVADTRGFVSVRGEVLMSKQMFKNFNNGMKNPRNAAAGLLKKKSGIGADHLSFIAYDVTAENQPFDTEVDKLRALDNFGFTTVYTERTHSLDYVNVMRATLANGLRDEIAFEIDGLVIKCNAVDRDDESLTCPERQIAYKFDSEEAVATVTGFEWSQNGARLTPVCLIEPTPLMGVTVSRATLHTVERYNDMALAVGDKILVSRRGDVIPHVEKLVAPADAYVRYFSPPPCTCPACNSALTYHGAFLDCSNENCPEVLNHRFYKWFITLGVKGIGPATIAELTKHCKSLVDVYELSVEDIVRMGFGPGEATNVYNAIQSKRDISIAKLIAGFDIPEVGETAVQALVTFGFRTLDRFIASDARDFILAPGIGEVTAENIVEGIAKHFAEMSELVYRGHIMVTAEVTEGALVGHVVVFTGALNTMSREEAVVLAKGAGAVVKDSLVKTTTLLVTNDTSSGSAKNKKAAALGVRVVNEEDFIALTKGL